MKIFQINELKVSNEMELGNLLKLILEKNIFIYKKKLKIQKYSKDYFTKLNSESLVKKVKKMSRNLVTVVIPSLGKKKMIRTLKILNSNKHVKK